MVLNRFQSSIPKNGKVAEPGLVGVAPANGAIKWEPDSVCQKVSLITDLPLPILSLYHSHKSGAIGSPTEPKVLKDDRSYLSISSSPTLLINLNAVGAT
ncbi:hypothetical protein WICMUC_003036 [Wickerhamomyces mucosus]|uniref:Uncharacterized protein n=1 Tax=Wickerhamomyces mucosus TaxID=1378264 RepID=A0A9P8PM65_9ASCO|nr:hypothetical protein WICMUC_003036 [Wickerhamomyces mucosus]